MRAHHVGARGVDRLEAELDRPLLHLGRYAVGREDHRPFFDVLEPAQPVRLVHQRDPLLLQVVGGVGVVHEHAEHVHGAFGLLTHALGDAERIHHAVAVPARRDLDYFHGGIEFTDRHPTPPPGASRRPPPRVGR